MPCIFEQILHSGDFCSYVTWMLIVLKGQSIYIAHLVLQQVPMRRSRSRKMLAPATLTPTRVASPAYNTGKCCTVSRDLRGKIVSLSSFKPIWPPYSRKRILKTLEKDIGSFRWLRAASLVSFLATNICSQLWSVP